MPGGLHLSATRWHLSSLYWRRSAWLIYIICAVPYSEMGVLSSLVDVRVRLTALKKDRSEYIKAHDVFRLYRSVLEQGEILSHKSSPLLSADG